MLSPAFVYEVLVRSDLMANFLLVAAILNGFARKHVSLKNHWLCIAVAVGLLMSTRLTTVVAFTLWLLPDYLRQPWKIKLLMPLVAMAVFALTFLPLLFWNADMLLFFRDPLNQKPNEANDMDMLRLCDMHNIPVATNIATAEVLIHGLERGDLDWRNIIK